ncbi:hypothetical protein [Flavobacterium sp. PL02]|jgi:hypothetical protein|uniref:hypothetical protein n=1 Tax=Flavobacterium sp. PL02 TaxID=3088354 RepID=UPI002B23CA41|nr:hypothetical protein [Flavobacterium sp. PL02]MEA9415884.1 hypothetical protein [Flavobacterium sp. PL02]
MKRIIAISCFVLTSIVFVSCTNDDDETTSKLNVSADAPGDGQNGQTPISPPKP